MQRPRPYRLRAAFPGGIIRIRRHSAIPPLLGFPRRRHPYFATPPACAIPKGMNVARRLFIAQGRVQGVGFRPFVFALAEEFHLTGLVRNASEGVRIEVQGTLPDLEAFAEGLRHRLPPLAALTDLRVMDLPPATDEPAFIIAPSDHSDCNNGGAGHAVLVSPDTALCADCRADMAHGRRAGYAFTNCTNCGPRYTITRSIPYDRPATSMACFPLCPTCRAEYENPKDRRFHAQPNACPECGPTVWFSRQTDPVRTGLNDPASLRGPAALEALADFLHRGGLAAVKGLGGFHLACNAFAEEAVERLRLRKNRPHKPLALMVPSLAAARLLVEVGGREEALLTSPAHPIVLCRKKPNAGLPESLAPDTDLLGLMLPYTPLHEALFTLYEPLCAGAPAALVMTSGNRGGEPICLSNREAVARLAGMAEAFLFHNRDILIRVDDSVIRPLPDGHIFLRRARGYVPLPTPLPVPEPAPEAKPRCVLGAGAELKHTLCLTKGTNAFVSQHIGDMENVDTADFAEEIRLHLQSLLQVRPDLVVRDLHPGYRSGELAETWAKEAGVPCIGLPHHAAHAFAVLAENTHTTPALTLTLDGTGLGADGTLQGGEIFLVHPQEAGYMRLARLDPLPLPGGEAAVREPWRMAYALLLRYNLLPQVPFVVPEGREDAARLIPAMLERGLNCPLSSGCGRLFDAVAALLGLCDAASYEGQAAVRLETAAGQYATPMGGGAPPLNSTFQAEPTFQTDPASSLWTLPAHELFLAAAEGLRLGVDTAVIARNFHLGLARMLAQAAAALARKHKVSAVGLSGGCLNNAFLASALVDMLREAGLTPLLHRELPPGDGCISYGQAVFGLAQKF